MARRLRDAVFRVLPPGGDGLERNPVRDRDAKPGGVADALHPEKPRLLGGELDHALTHRVVTLVHPGALRGEDHREIRWLGSQREGLAHRRIRSSYPASHAP